MAVMLTSVFILVAGSHSAAFAQGGACKEDVQRLCSKVSPGKGQIMKCLQEHRTELSTACQEQIQTAKSHAKELGEACQSDVQQLCPAVKPGRGALAKCLKQHESELSPACKEELAQARSVRKSPR
jgi:hypothetical protein